MKKRKQNISSPIHSLRNILSHTAYVLLDNPFLFNIIRYFLAGNQKDMKRFIKKFLIQYHCTTIADICCGTGDFAQLTPKNANYIGLDNNKAFILYARKKYIEKENILFYTKDVLERKNFSHQYFDAFLLISTIHHFSDQDLKLLLPIVKKHVKKVVIIADIIPNPPHPIQRLITSLDRGGHIRYAEEKIKILKKYFTIVHTQEIPTRSAVQYGIICIPK